MFIYTLYTLTGERVGQTIFMHRAMKAARCYAVAHRAPCIVECRVIDTNESRRVLLNADGSIVKLWQAA